MDKKKILFVVEALGGGVFTYIVNLSNALSDRYDIYIAHGIRKQTPENYRSYFRNNIHLIRVKNFTRSINPVKEMKALCELVKIGKKVKPDCIHLHSSKAGVLGRLAYATFRCPIYYTPHGYSFLMEGISRYKRGAYFAVEWLMARVPSTIISCSAGEYRESCKLTSKVKLVNNGINRKEIDGFISKNMQEKDHETRRYRVFTLGRICYQKNPELFNDIALKMPDIDFIWIGTGELADKLNAPNITITGWTERESALEIAYKADCFILPSRWEGLPISLLEAMYLRKPCIVSDVVGNHDVIHSGINGYVCTTSDEFVSAIRKIQNNKGIGNIVDTAYQDILSKYNIELMAEKYSQIYEDMA